MVLNSVPEANPLLPEPNRAGELAQDWAGNDQQWWDWYVTLAANDGADGGTGSAPLVAGPGLPDVEPADDGALAAALAEPYPLRDEQVAAFRAASFVKLPDVLPPAVVRRLADRLDVLLRAEHGDDTAGRFTALEQMWRNDPLMRSVALSRRLGDLAAALVGADVRIYHDNALSKEPGCGRTPWHHDAEHFPLATLQAVTAWMPVSAVPAPMGPLSFARGADLRPLLDGLRFDRVGTSYDRAVSERFAGAHVRVADDAYAVGDVSFHGALCFHTAGRNGTTQPRRALATTYYADGARVVDSPTLISGTWREFLPGVQPGEVAATELNPVVGRLPGGPPCV